MFIFFIFINFFLICSVWLGGSFLHGLKISFLRLNNHWLELSCILWSLSETLWRIKLSIFSLVFFGLCFQLVELWLDCFHVFALIDELLHFGQGGF